MTVSRSILVSANDTVSSLFYGWVILYVCTTSSLCSHIFIIEKSLPNLRTWSFLFHTGILPWFTVCTSFLAPHAYCPVLSPFPFSILSFSRGFSQRSSLTLVFLFSFHSSGCFPSLVLCPSWQIPRTSCCSPAILTYHSHTHKLSQTLLPFEFPEPCFGLRNRLLTSKIPDPADVNYLTPL